MTLKLFFTQSSLNDGLKEGQKGNSSTRTSATPSPSTSDSAHVSDSREETAGLRQGGMKK